MINVQRVDAVTFTAFEHLIAMTRQRLALYENRIARQAVVRPHGLIGALVEGFSNLVVPQYGWRVVDSAAAALEWLGESTPPMYEHVDQIERVVEETRGLSLPLARLRAWFASQPVGATIEEVARAQGLSRRSFQRLLGRGHDVPRRERAPHARAGNPRARRDRRKD